MKLIKLKFPAGGGVQNKKPSVEGEYGYFLELHVYNNKQASYLETGTFTVLLVQLYMYHMIGLFW